MGESGGEPQARRIRPARGARRRARRGLRRRCRGIGDYERCSWYTEGTGTFFGGEATAPTIGERGREERVPELRLETVYPAEREAEVVRALREAHPYEEPAFDLYRARVKARLFTDGGARGNPGPAAYAYVLEAEDGTVLAAHGEAIGVATNNVAEYRALVEGLRKARAFLSPSEEPPVLGHVVRRNADRLAVSRQHGAVLGLEHVAVGRGTRISAGASIRGRRAFTRVDKVESGLFVRMRVPERLTTSASRSAG